MDITLVFFIYGLAFFSMGLAMLFESARSPLLAEVRVLRPLAIFGLVHGGHEWLEMFLDKSDWLVFQNPIFVSWLRLGVLVISFVSLVVFGLRVLQPQTQPSRRDVILWVGGLSIYVIVLAGFGFFNWSNHTDRLSHLDAMARSLLAVPAATLAGIALTRWANRVGKEVQPELKGVLNWGAWGFFLYAFTQAVVPPVDIFPWNIFNTTSFIQWTGIPIQVVRAVLAVIITVSLIRATQMVEAERQRQLISAQQERMAALGEVRRQMERRESQRQELLRHIVIAQEEERARIARELHDETSQTLAAFSLHLASMRCDEPDCPKVDDHVDQLQELNRKISTGIYRLIHDLRPAHLDDLGLVAALNYLNDAVKQQLSLQVNMYVKGDPYRLDSLVETVCYRVAQEALSNVSRHSGVDKADLRLEFTPQQVLLQVSDQGVGFDPEEQTIPPRGWGLAGMRERAQSVGAVLDITSELNHGTVVEVIMVADKNNNTTSVNTAAAKLGLSKSVMEE